MFSPDVLHSDHDCHDIPLLVLIDDGPEMAGYLARLAQGAEKPEHDMSGPMPQDT